MDLVTLNDDHQPEKLIERYDSLIWTERYTVGDFQITTGNIDQFMELLPEGQVVSLRESTVPMIVERHLIERKKNQPTILTIKGREFTKILDQRVSINDVSPGASPWTVVTKIPSDVAYYIINQICELGIADPNDIFPPSVVQFLPPDDYLTGTGPSREFTVPKGNLLATVLGFLQTEFREDTSTTPDTPAVVPHGIRSIRPNAAGTAVAIEIYTGTDRSESIYFDGTRRLLEDGAYLFSKEGSADTAYIVGTAAAAILNKGTAATSGMDRRVIYIDGENGSDDAILEKGKKGLAEAHPTSIFHGGINQDLSPYRYGVDYGLGDIVKLVGDYGLEEKARVTEYIRSDDRTGFKAYPTLVTVPE